MPSVAFVKVEASGNDFVLVDARGGELAGLDPGEVTRDLCRRRRSVGADGLVVVDQAAGGDLRVVHLEPDGARTFCLNALRGVAAWAASQGLAFDAPTPLLTDAGPLLARRDPDTGRVAVRLPAPRRLEPRTVVLPGGVVLEGTFVDVGNPQLVVPLEREADLEHEDLMAWGRAARRLEAEFPGGTNVSFVARVAGSTDLRVRTYERGVEDETLACGTGILAVAFALLGPRARDAGRAEVRVHTRGGETQGVTVFADGGRLTGAWSEGPARVVAHGEARLDRPEGAARARAA